MRSPGLLGARWLGVGLAATLSVVTLGLFFTGRLGLYINPESSWFAVGMAIVVVIGTVLSFLLPLGAEADHGHDHGSAHAHDDTHADDEHADDEHVHTPRPFGGAIAIVGGVAATGVAVLTLVLPPASLSAELAMSRNVGSAPLFAGADVVNLASSADTSSFGIGDWAGVFATATDPGAFDGDQVTLTGFVTPGSEGFDLTRLVITHCVIDAQTASLPVTAVGKAPETGQWVTVKGTVKADADGKLVIDAATVDRVDEPQDPYEY